jgi:hypothetical protein
VGCTSPKANVWCAVMHDKIFGRFLFRREHCALGPILADAMPQIQGTRLLLVSKQDGAPAREVSYFKNAISGGDWSNLMALQLFISLQMSYSSVVMLKALLTASDTAHCLNFANFLRLHLPQSLQTCSAIHGGSHPLNIL